MPPSRERATPSRQRVRDPGRKQRILTAAAELSARRGFHAISMADIGAEAGIVGSGIYRHFGSKTSILVAMLDQVMDRIATGGADIIAAGGNEEFLLSELGRDQITVSIEDREVLAVYHREIHTLPEEDRRRLRRRQRHYIEDWVHLLAPLRRDLTDSETRRGWRASAGGARGYRGDPVDVVLPVRADQRTAGDPVGGDGARVPGDSGGFGRRGSGRRGGSRRGGSRR